MVWFGRLGFCPGFFLMSHSCISSPDSCLHTRIYTGQPSTTPRRSERTATKAKGAATYPVTPHAQQRAADDNSDVRNPSAAGSAPGAGSRHAGHSAPHGAGGEARPRRCPPQRTRQRPPLAPAAHRPHPQPPAERAAPAVREPPGPGPASKGHLLLRPLLRVRRGGSSTRRSSPTFAALARQTPLRSGRRSRTPSDSGGVRPLACDGTGCPAPQRGPAPAAASAEPR